MDYPINNTQGEVSWRCPSNIALIKYWGKYGNQLPRNASISFTLKNAFTETSIKYFSREDDLFPDKEHVDFKFFFEGKENPKFEEKIRVFLNSIIHHFPFLIHFSLEIHSYNSFPHSTGIASSASSMAALAMCLTDIENTLDGRIMPQHQFYEKASEIARLGSGSACRSIFPFLAAWGKHPSIPLSSNEYAVPFTSMDPVFKSYKDAILIVSSEEKSVSSRAGHSLMNDHPFADCRYKQAEANMSGLVVALKSGDLSGFSEIVENEALTLHALMMASMPSYMLMLPETLKIIDLIKSYRTKKAVPLCFTLDAGPNVHLLYPAEAANEVETFIRHELLHYCEEGRVIYDEVGNGPVKIK